MVEEHIIHHDVPSLVHITISVNQDSMKCMVMVHMARRCIHGMWQLMIIKNGEGYGGHLVDNEISILAYQA